MSDPGDSTADALERGIGSLTAYLASLERRLDAMQRARLDEAHLRNFGREIAGNLANAAEADMKAGCLALREAIARLEAQRAALKAEG